jgi:RHH-type proline utilization regulon transcriptional repressor/proline dehydrogenase/delta 1-pyrroline-5-carboxylate dehydrogenase
LDISWAMSLPAQLRERIEFEMLEGMAPAHARSVRDRVGSVLLYAPVVRGDDRPAAISYLARRLDENTSEDNFLRWMFAMRPGSQAWRRQVEAHTTSLALLDDLDLSPRRADDRSGPGVRTDPTLVSFVNAPDTDWTVPANRRWIEDALASCVVVEPAEVTTAAEVDAIVERAGAAAANWSATSWQVRRALLASVADVIEARRGSTVALMATAAAKVVAEADAEVSEAVDAARFAAWSTHAIELATRGDVQFGAHGVVVVAAPWNFPFAIPALGVCAAIAAGNTVILKPAPETRAVAAALVEQVRLAGVPDDVIQLACTPDDEVGRRLICDPRVDMVVLTGAAETAALFRTWRPSIRLVGETSGKNAMVITAAADEDLAIKDLVKSAFGHAGQKCSAASVAIVEASVYDDGRFLARLADAVRSLRVGSSAALPTMVGPLIAPPSDRLQRALTTLEPGEAWLVQPTCLDPETNLWSPGVRIGVQRGSFLHRTECFGPVLAVIRADDLDDAVAIQNDSEFGLTGGIHSLDEWEVSRWLERVEVGNAYVNRPITGAIVQRQPFGGWKRSSVGCGSKAGGPWYVESFGAWTGGNDDEQTFGHVWAQMVGHVSDPSGLRSERNEWRVRPLPGVRVHIGDGVDAEQRRIVEIARRVTGVPAGGDRVRVLGDVDDALLAEWYARGWDVDRSVPVADARIELRRWVREQAVSITAHRLGRLITPAG